MNVQRISIVVALLIIISLIFFLNTKGGNALSSNHGQAAYDHTAAILDCGPRPPESEGLAKAQKYISEELSKHGWSTISQTVERDTPVGKRKFTNLIARYNVEKLDSIEDLIKLHTQGILCAHLDSKLIPSIPNFLGADDAASACGLIIELAVTFSQQYPEKAKQLELVFFDGEEAFAENMSLASGDGLYGSRAYAIDLYKRDPKPVFGILLDMVGHKNLKIAAPADSPDHLFDAMMTAAEKHGHEKRYTKATGGILDDHYYLNKAGVPTIDIIGADFNHTHWWHKEGDTMDLISAKSLSISYDVTFSMLEDLIK